MQSGTLTPIDWRWTMGCLRATASVGTTTNRFFYDGWAMIRETDGSTTNDYAYGLDLSGSMQGAGTIGGLLAATLGGTTSVSSVFYAYDANGNVTELLNTDGASVAHYEYDTFGNIIRQTGDAAEDNPFRFSTKYTDDETGLLYYGLRYYSPDLARWPSRDPIGENGGMNLYGFVGNDVPNSFDVFGLWSSNVHKELTTTWAKEKGYSGQSSVQIGIEDNNVDFGPTGPLRNSSYHFNIGSGTGDSDSRLLLEKQNLKDAKEACDWSMGNDDYIRAAKSVGYALHPLQDWVAHGDFPGGKKWHNYNGPFLRGLTGELVDGHRNSPYNMQYYPDTTWLDADGPDGRPSGQTVHDTNKATFHVGSKRLRKTRELTYRDLVEFLTYMKSKSKKECGKCRRFFLTEETVQ